MFVLEEVLEASPPRILKANFPICSKHLLDYAFSGVGYKNWFHGKFFDVACGGKILTPS